MKRSRGPGRPKHDDVLTLAEWRTVHAVTHGLTSRAIADANGISIDGVKFHVTNALGKLGLDGRGELRHWFQAPRDSALARQENPMDASPLGPIGQISRTVTDAERSLHWFRDELGLPHLFTFGNMVFFDCGGTRLMLVQGDGAPTEESLIYFSVGNIAATYERLKGRGVEFTNAPHLIHRHADGTEEWLAFFKDLEGRPLALVSRVKS